NTTNSPIDTVEHVKTDPGTDDEVTKTGSTVDGILARFDQAIERLQTPPEPEPEPEKPELDAEPGPEVSPPASDAIATGVDVDTGPIVSNEPDIAIPLVSPSSDDTETTPAVSYPIAHVTDAIDKDAMVSIRGLTKSFGD